MKPIRILSAIILFTSLMAMTVFSKESAIRNIQITSSAFKEGEFIPAKYTCDGKNVSPPLRWEDVPANTKSIALISDDHDAPAGDWVHWIVFNIPAQVKELQENIPVKKILDNGAKQGLNDFHKIGYGGPCPPGGTHRYFFKIYALDTELQLNPGSTKTEVLKAMGNHVLGQGQLTGKYKRK